MNAQNTGGVAMCPESTVDALAAGLRKGFGGTFTGAGLLSAAAAAAPRVICRDIVRERVGEVNG